MMNLLFDRGARHDRVASEPPLIDGIDVARKPYFDSADAGPSMDQADESSDVDLADEAEMSEQLQYLTEEVDHLKACLDHLLDILDAQGDVADEVSLLADRMGVSERRIHRVEDAVADVPRRRAGDPT